jgi:hypothetical protein
LGVLLELTFGIAPNKPVQRRRSVLTPGDFAEELTSLQAAFTAARATGTASAMWEAIQAWDEVQVITS